MSSAAFSAPDDSFVLFDRLLALYLATFAITHQAVVDVSRLGICLVACTALVLARGALPRSACITIAALLLLNLGLNWFQSANHTFLTTTVVLLMATRRPGAVPATALRWLLVMVMGFAVIQKLLSANFLSGRLLALYILQGDILPGPMSWVWPGLADAVAANRANFDAARSLAADGPVDLPLVVPGTGLGVAARAGAWLIIAAEASIAVLAAGARRRERAFHVALLGFIGVTYLLRNENHFLALLCLLGLGCGRAIDRYIETAYLAAVIVLCALAVLNMRAPWISGV